MTIICFTETLKTVSYFRRTIFGAIACTERQYSLSSLQLCQQLKQNKSLVLIDKLNQDNRLYRL